MEITLLSAQGLKNAVLASSVHIFVSTHHLVSISPFFLGLTTPAPGSQKCDELVLNWGEEKVRTGVEPGFFASSSSYILLQITRIGKRLMSIGPRREEVLSCWIPVSDVRFPVSFLSYRMRKQRDGSRSEVVVNLRVDSGRLAKEMQDLHAEMAPVRGTGQCLYGPPPGAAIGLPAIKQLSSVDWQRQEGSRTPLEFATQKSKLI
ncbi:hypothetical protein MLD38_020920 [Melastoma candidum]|uniref:Uncharacterized protein n=1 Tax=Melastoma candidum TaxID=119954 RepID=A0ACB9QDZ3_9MYRT|nr:hypothetical protein MLD38_020920 [Melastoma candidum]